MHRIILPAAAIALLAACGGGGATNNGSAASANEAAPTPAPTANIAAYLPTPGEHRARAMAIAVPPEIEPLAARMTAAIRANFAWYRTYAAQHPQGELPWHPNLGISAEEYRRFQALAATVSLREIGPATLYVTRQTDGGLAFAAAGPAAPLNGIVIYPDRNQVVTPLGQLTNGAPAANREVHSPTGPWEGVRWTNLGTGARTRVALSLGRRAQGDMLIFYDYGPSDAESVVLLYPATPAATPARP